MPRYGQRPSRSRAPSDAGRIVIRKLAFLVKKFERISGRGRASGITGPEARCLSLNRERAPRLPNCASILSGLLIAQSSVMAAERLESPCFSAAHFNASNDTDFWPLNSSLIALVGIT